MKRTISFLLAFILCISMLTACGNKEASNTGSSANSQQTTAATEETTAKPAEPVTLTQLTWRVPDVADAFTVFTKKYQDEHPNVTIDVMNIASDQYYNTLETRLLGGDPPDIMATAPGAQMVSQAKNEYILDITNEPMMKNVMPGQLENTKIDGKIYGIPYDVVSLVVLYNKKIFADNGIQVPTNYDEMLQICEKLKANNITPVAYGIKDSYLTQFLPYQISPTAVYAKNPNWDSDLIAGKVKYNSPEWIRALGVPFELSKKGYFTKNALGIGDQQSVEMFAKGEAAMTFNGTWAVTTSKAANPDIDLGVFPFPANQAGEELWMTTMVGQVMAISKTSKNLDESKKYLAAWTDKDYAQLWTDRAKAISTIIGVENSFDPIMNELIPYMEKLKAWQFANAGWPVGVTDVLIKKFQEVYAGKGTLEDMLNAMDKAVADGLAKK